MTQISRPQPGHQSSGYLDAGPYSADQWAELHVDLFVGDRYTQQGPFVAVGNELEVTNPSGANIQVDTGRGMSHGHELRNTTAITFAVSSPVGNPRIDVVCLVENNTAVARTQGIATPNDLIFPTSLTDYEGTASLKPYTCRLAILKGTPAGSPVAPTLDVDTATLFMVPLAQYQISTGGVVSALTDRREFARFSTNHLALLQRQGGSATDWSVIGTTNRDVTLRTLIQVGARLSDSIVGGTTLSGVVTFPTPFSAPPIVFVSITGNSTGENLAFEVTSITAASFSLAIKNNGVTVTAGANWLAIGPA